LDFFFFLFNKLCNSIVIITALFIMKCVEYNCLWKHKETWYIFMEFIVFHQQTRFTLIFLRWIKPFEIFCFIISCLYIFKFNDCVSSPIAENFINIAGIVVVLWWSIFRIQPRNYSIILIKIALLIIAVITFVFFIFNISAWFISELEIIQK